MADAHSSKHHGNRLINMTGQRYGRLLVIGRAPSRNKNTHWLCACDCGGRAEVEACNLRKGRQVSCGCYRAERTAQRSWRHGEGRKGHESAEFSTWMGIIKRCCDAGDHNYKKYGARGITICDEWRRDYPAFLKAVGRRPTKGHSIDRIDNGGNYEPGNVRWATRKEQGRNKRNNRWIAFNGQTKTVPQWADELGIPSTLIHGRLDKGWSGDRTLTQPVLSTRKEYANNRRSNRFLTFNGVTRTVSQWSDAVGLRPSVVFGRLYLGWSNERTLTTPYLGNK